MQWKNKFKYNCLKEKCQFISVYFLALVGTSMYLQKKRNTSITSYLTKVTDPTIFASIVCSWWKECRELSSFALFYKCLGKYQQYICDTNIPKLFPPQTAKGVSGLEMNTVTRDAYPQDWSSFNKKKNLLKQSTVDENLILPFSYFLTFSSFFLTFLRTSPLYRRCHLITLNKCQKMLQHTQKLQWSSVFPNFTKDTPSFLGRKKIAMTTK